MNPNLPATSISDIPPYYLKNIHSLEILKTEPKLMASLYRLACCTNQDISSSVTSMDGPLNFETQCFLVMISVIYPP
jgi:hypothetical protein